MRPGALAALLALAAWALGCGGPDPTPTPTPVPIDLEALLRDSGRVMGELDTFHFLMTHESGGTPLTSGILAEEVEGDVAKPDSLSIRFSGSIGGFAFKASVITLGGDTFMTSPVTGDWQRLPEEVSPLGFFDPRKGIASMMTQVRDVSLLSGRDEPVLRLEGVLPVEALTPLVGQTVEGTHIDVELAIESSSRHLLEVGFSGRVTPTEPDGTVRLIKLSRFGVPVTIEPPL